MTRIALLTGATRGIGRAAAPHLARSFDTLILVGRDGDRLAETAGEVRTRSGNPHVETLQADLSSMAEVRRVAAEVRRRADHLDLLANNAGAYVPTRELTPDGFERTFALNHLAYFLLTHELLPLLQASAGPARIVSTASGAHWGGSLDLDDLQGERSWSPFGAYARSKLANILFTRELARRRPRPDLTANCFHPGAVASGFAADAKGVLGLGFRLARPLMRTPEDGADTLVWLATAPEAATLNGEYVVRRQVGRTSRQARDEDLARRLWGISEELLGLPRTDA